MRGTTNALSILGTAIMDWQHDMEDIFLAIRAADVTARHSKKTVYIMPDLRIMLPEHATEAPLEVVRYYEQSETSPARWIP